MTDYRTEAPQIVKEFLHYQTVALDHSEQTINEYYLDLRTFFRFMKIERGAVQDNVKFEEIPIDDITVDFVKNISKTDIYEYISFLRADKAVQTGTKGGQVGLSPSTTNRRIACLRSFFNYLVEKVCIMGSNPMIGIDSAKTRKRLPTFLTEEESVQLLNSIDGNNKERDYAIILLALVSGLRVSEIVSINIQDIRKTDGQYFLSVIGKGNKERQVFISDNCAQAINEYLAIREETYAPTKKDADALFLSRKHNRISVDAVQHLVKQATKKAGLKEYSPHKLRHTSATLMLKNGVDIRAIQEVLGHSNLATTQIYAHVDDKMLREACYANPISHVASQKKF